MVSDIDAPAIRRFLEEIGYPVDPGRLVERPDQLPSTLCYLVVDGRLLMLRREKEPFAHHWTAPGGKIQPGETPRQAIEREVREETGLSIVEPKLKAICSETGGPDYNWLLFIFRAERSRPAGAGRRGGAPLAPAVRDRRLEAAQRGPAHPAADPRRRARTLLHPGGLRREPRRGPV